LIKLSPLLLLPPLETQTCLPKIDYSTTSLLTAKMSWHDDDEDDDDEEEEEEELYLRLD